MIMKDSNRFYLPDGSTVVGLRAARKTENALPSVTTLLSCWPKPWLLNYKLNQMRDAALTLPRQPDESDDEFFERVSLDAEAHAKAGADRGSAVHDIILRGGKLDQSELALPPIRAWAEWQPKDERTIWTEKVLFGVGYAGRADRLQISQERQCYFLDDFKIRQTARIYDEDRLQLAAYHEALPLENWVHTRPRSIVIQADGEKIIVREWTDDELADAYTAFTRCKMLWCTANNYWPGERVVPHEFDTKDMAKAIYGNLAPQLT